MAMIKWDSTMSVGVPVLDAQHQKLLQLLNALHDAVTKGVGHRIVGDVIDDLVAYTKDHFTLEEQLLRKRGYPALDAHLAEHRKLADEVLSLQRQMAVDKLPTVRTLELLVRWMSGHIMDVDRRYRPHLENAPQGAS